MPTKSDVDAVREQVETLIEERSFARPDEGRVVVAPHGRGTEDGHCSWGELTREQQAKVLTSEVRWLGFEAGGIVEVSERIMEGESMEFWFDGIAVTDQVERREELFAEWREDERAARLRDGLDPPGMAAPVAEKGDVDPRFLNANGSASDRVTPSYVEWEMGKLRDRFFDDSVDPHRDEWAKLQQVERLRFIESETSICELESHDAQEIIAHHVGGDAIGRDIANPPRIDEPPDYKKAIEQAADAALGRQQDKQKGGPER